LSDLTPIVAPDDFPASRKNVYLNTASVCLMHSGAERAVVEWMHDLAENGTIHFDEAAEERAFATLHASAARLFNCRPEEIAVGSSGCERSLSELAVSCLSRSRLAGLVLLGYLYNAAACLEVAVIHSLDDRRYITVQMFLTLLAQFLALWFILEFALEIRDHAKDSASRDPLDVMPAGLERISRSTRNDAQYCEQIR
jgi:hypothetical protein